MYSCFLVVCGAILFAAFVGSVTAMIAALDSSGKLYRDKMSTLHQYFKKNPELGGSAKRTMVAYADAYFKLTDGVNEREIMRSQPHHVRPRVLLELHHKLIERVSFLQASL